MNENLTALYDEVRSFFNGEFLKFEMGLWLAFLLKKCKIFRLFVYIYREKSKHSHSVDVGFLLELNT